MNLKIQRLKLEILPFISDGDFNATKKNFKSAKTTSSY